MALIKFNRAASDIVDAINLDEAEPFLDTDNDIFYIGDPEKGKLIPNQKDDQVNDVSHWSSLKTVQTFAPKESSYGETVTLKNCLKGFPIHAVSTIDGRQEGSGTASPVNVRKITYFESAEITLNGTLNTAKFPHGVFDGKIDWDGTLHTYAAAAKFTGAENWKMEGEQLVLEDMLFAGTDGIANYLQWNTNDGAAQPSYYISGKKLKICRPYSAGFTVQTWKAQLSENPLVIAWKIENNTAALDLNPLTAKAGENVLRCNTGTTTAESASADSWQKRISELQLTQRVLDTITEISSLATFRTYFYGLRKAEKRAYQFEYTKNGTHQNIADALKLPVGVKPENKAFFYVELPYSEAGGFVIHVTLEGRTDGDLYERFMYSTLDSTWNDTGWMDIHNYGRIEVKTAVITPEVGRLVCDMTAREIIDAARRGVVKANYTDDASGETRTYYYFKQMPDGKAAFSKDGYIENGVPKQTIIYVDYDGNVTTETRGATHAAFAVCNDPAAPASEKANTWYIPKTMPRPSGNIGMMIDVQWKFGRVDGLGYNVNLVWGEAGGSNNEVILSGLNTTDSLTGSHSIPAEGTVRYQLEESSGRKRWRYVSGALIPTEFSTDTAAATADKAVHGLAIGYLPGMEIYVQMDSGNTTDVMRLVPDEGETLPVYGNGTGAKTGTIPAGYILHLKNAGDHWQIINGTDKTLGMTGAEPGDVVAIAAVDADGRPTKYVPVQTARKFDRTAPVVVCDPIEGVPMKITANLEPKQDGSGPYAQFVQTVCGKNIMRDDLYAQSGVNLGIIAKRDGGKAGILLKGGTTYTLCCDSIAPGLYVLQFDTNSKIHLAYDANKMTFTLKKDTLCAAYAYFGSSVPAGEKVWLTVGSQAAPYEPYTGTDYTVALGRSIYGGTINLSTGEALETYGSDGLPLAEPIPFTVAPQKIPTLEGTNTIYHDGNGTTRVQGVESLPSWQNSVDRRLAALEGAATNI